jgi:hypothetical protein
MGKLNRHRHKTARSVGARGIPISIDTIHEAGHAVARFITAKDMGFPESVAVHSIKMEKVPPSEEAQRAGDAYGYSGITLGPMYSVAIINATDQSGEETMTETIKIALEKGVDNSPWVRAKIVVAVGGPAAEATAKGEPFSKMWDAPECANDFGAALATCVAAGYSDEEAVREINGSGKVMMEMYSVPSVWNALLKLAVSLNFKRKLKGNAAWRIYSDALSEGKVV